MKVTFNLNNGANIHSNRSVTYDLDTEKGVKQFGYSKEEWLAFNDAQKYEIAQEWANQHIEISYEEED